MEQLIRDLNDPRNQSSSKRVQDIQRQIQHLQREKAAWQTGLDFLGNNDLNIRFYGALTLLVKINADWDNDGMSSDNVASDLLLRALISHYIRLVTSEDAGFVVQKLCSTLAALYQRIADTWRSPVRHVFASLLSQKFIDLEQIPSIEEVLGVGQRASPLSVSAAVRFAATLAEDVNNRTGRDLGESLNRLSDSCNDVFKLLDLGLGLSSNAQGNVLNGAPSAYGDQDLLALAQRSIRAIQPWQTLLSTHLSKASTDEINSTTETISQALGKVIRFYDQNDLRPFVLQTLTAVQQLSPRLLNKAEPEFPQSFMKSDAVRQSIKSMTGGNFDHEETLLVELLEAIISQVDFTSSTYLHSERLADVLQALQLLLRCDGVAAIDDTVCQVVLEIMNQFVDGYTDWSEDQDNQFFSDYVRQACEACFIKARMPVEEMSSPTQSWDADERSKFSAFRFDVQDFFLASFSILGSSLPSAMIRNLRDTGQPPEWPVYEISIFCLRAFADAMSDDPETFKPYIETAFGSQYFQAILQSADVPEQARKTTISFISDTTAFLKQHPNLMQILNFLFSSLYLPASAGSASQAIYTLCYEQRGSLTEALAEFIASLETVSDIEGIDRHRIYGGVAAIVQALSTEQAKVDPILRILQLLGTSTTPLVEPGLSEDLVLQQATDILRSMAAVGRGLRSPNDVLVDRDPSAPADAEFWIVGLGSHVQQQVLALYQEVISKTLQVRDSGLTEAASDFLRSGFTEEHPSPFKLSAAVSTRLLTDQISLDSANIDAVLACASCLLAAATREEMTPHLAELLTPVLSAVQLLLTERQRSGSLEDSSFPSATFDFVSRLLPKWIDPLLNLDAGQDALAMIIELALVVVADPDTLPRRSAASFFSALIDVSKPQKTLIQSSRQALNNLLHQNTPSIVTVILRLVAGECARSELEVFSDPIRRYVQYQPTLFKNVAREAMKSDSGVLSQQALKTTTIEQRNRFIAQVDVLRGNRKTNEVIKEFWKACRGAGFDYIA